MLNSGSCDGLGPALDRLLEQRLADAARTARPEPGGVADAEQVDKIAQGFAEMLYTALFKQMQETVREQGEDVDDEEEGDGQGSPVKDGVMDLVTMYMPKALAENPQDALAGYVRDWMKARYGDQLDERA